MLTETVPTEVSIADLRRSDRPSLYAGRLDDAIECPSCGKSEDIAFLAPEEDYHRGIAWCPCGAVFQLSDKRILTHDAE